MRRPILLVLLIDLIAIAAAVVIYLKTGEEKLGEGSFLTHLSAIQLLAVSWISFQIFRIRNRGITPAGGMGAHRCGISVPVCRRAIQDPRESR